MDSKINILLTIAVTAHALTTSTSLSGVARLNSNDFSGVTWVSMEGGAPIVIQGANMAASSGENSIQMESYWIEGVTLPAPAISTDDSFQSDASAGKITYRLPSIMELMSTGLDQFNGDYLPNGYDEPLYFYMEVVNNADSIENSCSNTWKCHVGYSPRATSILMDVVPSNVYRGQSVGFVFDAQNVHASWMTPSDQKPFDDLRIGGSLLDWSETVEDDFRLAQYNYDYFEAVVGDQYPGITDPKVHFYTGYQTNSLRSLHCNYEGDSCWTVKTHPVIDSIDQASGLMSGGQLLTIQGHGLNGTDIEVTVDGVPCQVHSTSSAQIECITGAKDQESISGFQPGSQGADFYSVLPDDTWTLSQIQDPQYTHNMDRYLTSFETYNFLEQGEQGRLQAWFVAPADGQYRFLLSCDDKCDLSLAHESPYLAGTTALDELPEAPIIVQVDSYCNWRDYFNTHYDGRVQKSEWITLERGNQYYIEGKSAQWGGDSHFTASVEIKPDDQTALVDHQNASPMIQQFKVTTDQIFEEWSITISNPDELYYQISFASNDGTVWTSDDTKTTASANTFYNRIKSYFRNTNEHRSDIEVTRVMYDVAQVVTEEVDDAVTIVYTIKMKKLIDGYSTTTIQTRSVDTQSQITVIKPQSGVKSALPINGKFVVKCTDPDTSIEHSSSDIAYNDWHRYQEMYIDLNIPFLRTKVRFQQDWLLYNENEISFKLIFTGLHRDIPLCKIESAQGEDALTGQNLVYDVTVVQNYAESLFFEPIHIDFLQKIAQAPQVLVSINGLKAVCPNTGGCDYLYTQGLSTITSQQYDSSLNKLNFAGTDLLGDIASATPTVSFGPVNCTQESITIDYDAGLCTLETVPVAGEWNIKVGISSGALKIDTTVESIVIPVQVSSIQPNTDVKIVGGQDLVITGDNFGVDPLVVSVTFEDGTECSIKSVQMQQIICTTNQFTTAAQQVVTIAVNVQAQDTSQTVTISSNVPSAVSMSPTSASPVLKTEVDIVLSADFQGQLSASDLTATLVQDSDSSFSKQLYVMSVNEASNSVKIKFPGAESGQYRIQIDSQILGRIENSALTLQVQSSVTSISPTQGSKYGGTLITITGENFSSDGLDNPVKIGDNYCNVITSSPTQITCQTDFLYTQLAQEEDLIVFLKTSEECNSVKFTFVEADATVADITQSFNEELEMHQVTLTGTNFDDSVKLFIDGFQQSRVTVEATSVVFNVVNLLKSQTSNVVVTTTQGYPEGTQIAHSLSFVPALLSIYPLQGVHQGTLLTVRGSGFGIEDENVNLFLRDNNRCKEVNVTDYGVFLCLTKSGEIYDYHEVFWSQNFEPVWNQEYYSSPSLAYTTTTNIKVETAAHLIDPDHSIMFTGSDFRLPDQSFTAQVSIGGIYASQVQVLDSTQLQATWSTTGVPLFTSEQPEIVFTYLDSVTGESYLLVAKNRFDEISKTALVVSSSTSGLRCSYAGNCQYQIDAKGLTGSLQLDDQSEITICGNTCQFDQTLSTAEYSICTVPQLATLHSIAQYEIEQANVVDGQLIYTEGWSNAELLYDGDNTVSPSFSSGQFYFGMQYKQDHVVILHQAKVFIYSISDITIYNNNLKLQGSNDNWVNSVDLHTFNGDIHEGWNYVTFSDEEQRPQYQSYRFYANTVSAWRVTEFGFYGIETIAEADQSQSTYECVPEIVISGEKLQDIVLNPVTYADSETPSISAISPRFGSVLGGTSVTLTGDNLLGEATVLFDDRVCEINSQSASEIICTTSDKPYVPGSSVTSITIQGKGQVATRGLVFRYVSEWADPLTWGGDIPPIEGDSVSIPSGQLLLVNVDSTPVLDTVIVEGGLIFAPDTENSQTMRTFDAHKIMIFNGFMEVGTEKNPYTSKLTITMHSDRFDSYLPVYGNKVIGVRFGELDMHGVERLITWTRLAQSVQPGDTQITLIDETDWQVGEEIVIAGTGWNNDCHETMFIAAGSGREFTLDKAFTCNHISEVPTYDGVEIPMRAEVGLLTRNVVYRGDPIVSPSDQYGAHIMIHSPGDETSVGRISYIELKDVGQAFKLGRYPIHFHMIGTIHKSYVQGNSIHQTYNRAVTTHGVFYFRVINNVAYDTMGHTFFVEDAIETANLYEHNLSIKVRASNSLLNTDQTPGGFWITHPDNWVRQNAIAGSDAYGFWYDMQEHSIGPSFSENICPEFEKLGEFKDNTAHSVKKYGLRIHHAHIPITHPCQESTYDADYLAQGETDPYYANPHVTATYEDFIAFKCGQTCAITERTGAVVFKNFKVADFGDSGIEYSEMENVKNGYGYVKDAVIVGKTGLNDFDTRSPGKFEYGHIHGIIGPRTEYFSVDGASFYNFNNEVEAVASFAGALDSAALGTCSKCFHDAATDSGGRTMHTQRLHFGADVTKMIKYQIPMREIIHDQDGTLTGLGASSFATYSYPHLLQPECTEDLPIFDGVICSPSVQIRKIIFYSAEPDSMDLISLKIAKWDQAIKDEITADSALYEEFDQDLEKTYFSVIQFRAKTNPSNSWALPIVTGHSYRLHWGENNDFESLKFEISDQWSSQDSDIYLMTNFTRVREAINVLDQKGSLIDNRTLIDKESQDLINGDNVLYNQTEVREFNWVVNGKDLTDRQTLTINAYECLLNCEAEAVVDCTSMNAESNWSDPESWTLKAAPSEGDDVVIGPCDNIVIDVDTPILKSLTVNGRLSFKNSASEPQTLTLNAKLIHVNAGEFLIGSSTNRYNGEATVRLHGEPNDETLQFSNIVEGGNKALVITGKAYFYGQQRVGSSRLLDTCLSGANQAVVESGLDWIAGDRVALLPTAMQRSHTDYAVIQSYDSVSGLLTFTPELVYYHWGQQESTEPSYGMDMRGEVILLTRNVKIVGEDNDSWGGHITVSDIVDEQDVERNGEVIFDSIEIYNCSQRNTHKAAIRFERAQKGTSLIQDSAVSGSLSWGFNSVSSYNVTVQTTAFVGTRAIGVGIQASKQITIDQVFIGDVETRPELENSQVLDLEACYAICSLPDTGNCEEVKVTNSIASGCPYSGFVAPGHTCGEAETQDSFKNNIAHSVDGVGVIVFPDPANSASDSCFEGSHIKVYKIDGAAIATHFQTNEAIISNSVVVDNVSGLSNQASGSSDRITTKVQSTRIFGEIPNFADDCPLNHDCFCAEKVGMTSSGVNTGSKPAHITMPSSMPMEKIKSYGEFGAYVQNSDLTFSQFTSLTKCGSKQSAYKLNKAASDYIPRHEFTNTVISDVEDDAMFYLQDPVQGWANTDDCGTFPCTAPSNVLLDFKDTSYSGYAPLTAIDFQIISDTETTSVNIGSCTFKEAWNAWQCQNEKLGVLIAIADDSDQEDRSVQPVYVTCQETGYTNKLNSMMDHMWDGFYTGQKRKSMFPILIENDQFYQIEYTGTPFQNMRYTLRASSGQLKIRVLYWNSGSYEVSVDGATVEANAFDTTIGKAAELTGAQGCGENRFVGGIDNYLEFVVTPECIVTVKPIDSFAANVRMDWTLDQFYSNGGQTSFADRVAGVLGIHASRIKVVSVYKGSVVVDFNVVAEPVSETTTDESLTEEEQQAQAEANAAAAAAAQENLIQVKSDLTTMISSQDESFGAPILSASTGDEAVIEDPSYTPPASQFERLTDPPPVQNFEEEPPISGGGNDSTNADNGGGGIPAIAGVAVGILGAIAAVWKWRG